MMNRQVKVIKLMLNENDYISVDSIARTLNASSKTIRNELDSCEQIILDNHCLLVRKPGRGVLIEGTLRNKQQLLVAISSMTQNQFLAPEERQRSIFSKLLLLGSPLRIKVLALDYYVSRSTINKDLQILNEDLKEFNLNIRYHKNEGVALVGKETDKRKAIAKYQITDVNNVVIYGMSDSEESFIHQFESLLNVDFNTIDKIVKESETKLNYAFSSEARLNLVVHIGIAINRAKQGNVITLNKELLTALKNQKEFKIAEDTAERIKEEFNVQFSETEVHYILLHLLGAKRIKELNVNNVKLSQEDPILEKLIIQFIKKMQQEMKIFLESDTELFNSLLLHLKPTINRLMYGLSLDNPLLEEIRFNYPSIYDAVENNVDLFKKKFKIPMVDSEIAYLVLHFAAARERNIKPVRTLVMCASGLGTSQLIVAKLRRAFSNLSIVDVVSSMEADKYTSENIDLIITTVPINSPIKTIIINPLLTNSDMRTIHDTVERKRLIEISDFEFTKVNSFTKVSLKNKEEALHYLTQQALKLGLVKENYLDGLHYRETLGPTVIEPYVAIPHAEVETVEKSGIIFVSLEEPILWIDNFEIKIIINVISKKEDIKKFSGLFDNLSYLSEDLSWWNSLESLPLTQLVDALNQNLLNHKKEG